MASLPQLTTSASVALPTTRNDAYPASCQDTKTPQIELRERNQADEQAIHLSRSQPVLGRIAPSRQSGAFDPDCNTSVCSLRSFPEHEFAYPNQMPHLIPREQIMCRKEQRHKRRQRVRMQHDRLEKQKKTEALKAIEEHARRVELRRLRLEYERRTMLWLRAIVVARSVAWNLSHDLIRIRNDRSDRETRLAALRARDNAARSIQRMARNQLVFKNRHAAMDFWRRSLLFVAMIQDHRWVAQLHVRCWRRILAIRKIKALLRDLRKNRGAQAVGQFMLNVRKIQRSAWTWLQARRRRRAILREIWDDIDFKMCLALEHHSKREWNPLEPLPVAKRQRGGKVDFTTRVPELINLSICKVAKLDNAMDKLVARLQRDVGVELSDASSCIQDRGVPVDLRDAAVERMFGDILNRFNSKCDHHASIQTRTKGRHMRARKFTEHEAYKILSLTSYKGIVHRVRDFHEIPSNCNKGRRTLIFFTAYRPAKLRDVVAEAWLEAYNSIHVPISANTMRSLLRTADKEAQGSSANQCGVSLPILVGKHRLHRKYEPEGVSCNQREVMSDTRNGGQGCRRLREQQHALEKQKGHTHSHNNRPCDHSYKQTCVAPALPPLQ